MTVAWLHAGVGSVVASPSAISDERAAVALPRLHAALAAGVPPAEALAPVVAESRLPLVCFGSGWSRPMRLARRASDWSGPAAAVRSSSISSRRRGTWRLSPPQCAISSMARSR